MKDMIITFNGEDCVLDFVKSDYYMHMYIATVYFSS